MTDFEQNEFDVLGELYFITSFQDLQEATGLNDQDLKSTLKKLFNKGWLRCYQGIDNELEVDQEDIENLFDKYHYLANKDGLFAHNSR